MRVKSLAVLVTIGALFLAGCAGSGSPSNQSSSTSGSGAANGPEAGELSDPVTINADTPAVTKLDASLKEALQRASQDAGQAGVEIKFKSGWRTAGYQQRLFDDAVKKYRSVDVAQKYVASPDKSAHVTGNAVDVDSMKATDWLAQRGTAYGLCQIYANESWHYELRTQEINQTGYCPQQKYDAAG